MKRILFCNLKYDLAQCRQQPHSFHLPYGLGIIMQIAGAHGIEYDFVDTYLKGDTEQFLHRYAQSRHEVVLFSAIVGNHAYDYLEMVFKRIKQVNPSAVIVLGGAITSVYPETLMAELPADIIVIGEGEQTFLELTGACFSVDRLSDIHGIAYRKGDRVLFTPPREPLNSPLENESCNPLFSHPDIRPLLGEYVRRQKTLNRGWDLAASRGCYGTCTFCKKVFDKPVRYFSAAYILELLEHIRDRFGITRFNFLDENFMTNRKNFTRFLDLLEKRKTSIQWRIRARIDNIPFDLIDRMQRLGLYSLMIGLESADQGVLDHYRKELVIARYRDLLKDVAERGLLFASIILGAPVESEQSIQATIDFVRHANLSRDQIAVSFLSPIPGSELFENARRNGRFPSIRQYLREYVGDFTKIEYNLSTLSDDALLSAQRRIYQAAEAT